MQCGFCRRWRRLFWAAAGLLMLAGIGRGQEALRISMAGDLAATVQQQANTSLGYYNVLLGPTAWRFSSGLGLAFNDNVRLQPNGESDLMIQPSMNVWEHWPVTLNNSLDVSLGVGYSEYLQHQDLSQFFITPGSGLSFDVYVGDFKINLHDRVTITEYAYQNPGAGGGNRDLISLENTAGTGVLWDLDKAMANIGYDHVNYVSLSQNVGEPDAASENLFANAGLRVRPELLLGLEAGGTLIAYNSQTGSANTLPAPDAAQWSVGTFGSAQISDYISVRADAGYTAFTPDSTATNLVTSDTTGFYLSLSLSHRVNRFLSYSLAAGRSTDLAAYGQAQSYYFVRLTPNWNLFQKYTISTPVWWQQGTLVYNSLTGTEDYEQIGLGLNVSRSLTQKLSVGAAYQFVRQTSSLANVNYTVNIVSLNLNYQF